jgi:threonine/homoserine/homoserine lactone efflux protein
MDGVVGFVLAGVALAGSPGPATLSLAAAGAAFGARRAIPYMAGIVIGMVVVMIITASGVTGVLLALPGAAPYFLYLAFRIATAPPLSAANDGRGRPSFASGLLLSLINPKGYAAMAALFSGFILVRERLVLDAAAKIVVLLLIITAVNVAWLFAGAALTRAFRTPRLNRIINIGFVLLLMASLAMTLAF